MVDAAEENLAQIGPIANHDQDSAVTPGLAVIGAMTAAIEPGRNRAELLPRVVGNRPAVVGEGE
jgi:hypothetical protein